RKAKQMAYTVHTAPVLGSLRDHLRNLLGSTAARYAQWRNFRTTLAELDALGERELSDLGLSRSDCRRIAYRAAYLD
ncbi:MAG: DUF1127 domain-containing protein, partial [Pseudomonadota bacterium]